MGDQRQIQVQQQPCKADSVQKKAELTVAKIHSNTRNEQRSLGNQVLQAKLTIGAPNDKYEQEADRVADQVMRMPDGASHQQTSEYPSLSNMTISRLQRQPEEEEEEEESLQTKRVGAPLIQRQTEEEEEEELAQPKLTNNSVAALLQRQTEEEDEEEMPAQAKRVDNAGTHTLQRQAEEEEEETLQPTHVGQTTVQRQIEEEEETLQSKASSTQVNPAGSNLSSQVQQLRGGGSELSPQAKGFFEPRFGRDFSAVRVHTGQRAADAASAAKARAFTVGRDIVFGAGQFQPQSERGKHLLAHELTHVVQQNPATVQRKPLQKISPLGEHKIQTRRLPPAAEVTPVVSPGSAGAAAHRRGLARLVTRSMAELSPAQQAAVRTRARGALSSAQFAALPAWQRNQRLSRAIHDLHPDLRHGDPSQFLIGPRTAQERANLIVLVSLANVYFDIVALGALDAHIDQVFGAVNRNTVKNRYANAKIRMNQLHTSNDILTDRSGYTGEVELGGLTDTNQIMIDSHSMDNPGDNDSIITMIHESIHAGNAGIGDWGYNNGSLVFRRMSTARKLINAAHYEVPIWRVLAPADARAHTGLPFTPASAASPMTVMQQGIQQANDKFEDAWSSCLDVHEMYMDLYQHPAKWVVPLAPLYSGAHANARFRNTLPYWSKVSKLTMYQRVGTISHTSADIGRRPVTRIDLSLSEGVARKLSQAGSNLPTNQAAAQAFITANATSAQRTNATGNAGRIANLLVRLVLQRRVGRITGGIARDVAVVNRYAWANSFSRLLTPRNPSAFPFP